MAAVILYIYFNNLFIYLLGARRAFIYAVRGGI